MRIVFPNQNHKVVGYAILRHAMVCSAKLWVEMYVRFVSLKEYSPNLKPRPYILYFFHTTCRRNPSLSMLFK